MAWVVFDAFFNMDVRILFLAVAFVVIFAALMFSLGRSRIFQTNNAIKTIVAFAISLLCIYGLANSRIDLGIMFYRIGFSEEFLYRFLLIGLAVLFVLAGFTKVRTFSGHKKRIWKLYRSMITFGLLFLGIGVTPLVRYSKAVVIGIGLGLIILGLIVRKSSKKKNRHTKIKLI